MDKTGKSRALAYIQYQRSCLKGKHNARNTHSQSMDHRLEPQVNLASPDDLSDILHNQVSN